MTNQEERKLVEPKSRAEWREWLAQNHTQKESVWLAIARKGHEGVSVPEAVEEALCFGWIDGRANKLDDKRWKMLLSPRKPKSTWSKINKVRVARLIKAGLMQPQGLAMIKLAKINGSWNTLNDIDQVKYPDDLIQAFNKSKKAKTNFDKFPPSAKKIILFWIQSAKTEETRTKRIKETVTKAARNERANQYVRKT